MNNFEQEPEPDEFKLSDSNLKSENTSISSQKEISFRKAIENAIPSGIAVIDNNGKQIYANQSFCKMVGWAEDELLGHTAPYVYWAKQDIENIQKALEQTLRNNIPKEGFDLMFCHKDGKKFPVNLIIAPFVQEDNTTFWVANVIDITERKKEEKALKNSQILLKSSIESQQGTIFFAIDCVYQYLFFNKAHQESIKFAYGREVREGMVILDCISSDDDRKKAKDNYDRALRGESFSIIQNFGDENPAYYESFFNPIFNDKGKVIGCTGLARNVTKRRTIEVALQESETKLREIIDQINDGILVFNEQGNVIIWNKGAEQICGLTADIILNQGIADLYYQLIPKRMQDKELIEKEINDILSLKSPEVFNRIFDNEIITLNSRKQKYIQRKVFPIKLNGSNLFCMVFRDSTELKRYEKELLQISTDKDKFYAAITHYMYTPFNTFYNFAKVMAVEMDTLPIKELQKMAVIMSKSATNLYSLLDNLLQWTRMNQGKISFEPEELNFIKTCQDALIILKTNAEMKNIRINHFAEEEMTVFADIFMIKTILRNLVSNAINFISPNGQIDIFAQKTTSNVTVSVIHNGSELSSGTMKKLFTSSDINTVLDTTEEKGTTLGLLLCKEFVEKHGGKIWAEDGISNSCEIKFTLPTV